jgi:hypothetical protein
VGVGVNGGRRQCEFDEGLDKFLIELPAVSLSRLTLIPPPQDSNLFCAKYFGVDRR